MAKNKLNKLNIVSTLALIISLGVLAFHLTPCNIASGQINCNAAQTTGFSNPLRIDNSTDNTAISLSATPISGVSGLFSTGADTNPQWKDGLWNIVRKTADEFRITNAITTDPDLTFAVAAGVIEVQSYLLFSTTDAGGTIDAAIRGTTVCCPNFKLWQGGDETGGDFINGQGAQYVCHLESANQSLCTERFMANLNTSTTFELRFGQNVDDIGTTITLHEESFLIWRYIDIDI